MAITAEMVKSFHSLIVGSGSTSSPTLRSKWTRGNNAAKSVYPVRKFASQ